MPTLAQPFGNEDEQNQGQQAPQVSSAQGGTITSGANPGAYNPNTPTSSGRYSNIKKYLSANQDFNQQGGGLAGKVASNIQGAGQKVQQTAAGAKQDIQGTAQQQQGQWQQGLQQVQQAVVNPFEFSQNQQGVQQVAQARDAAYTGPKSFADLQGEKNIGQLSLGVQNVNQMAQAAQTDPGRFALLKQMFSKPTYSRGQQSLDNLLLQGNRQQLQQLAGTRKEGLLTKQQVEKQQAEAAEVAKNAQQAAEQAKVAARTQLNQAAVERDAAIRQKVEEEKAAKKAAVEAAKSQFRSGAISKDVADRFKLGADTNIYDVDLARFVQEGLDPTAQKVASEQQYKDIGALKNLLGFNPNDPAANEQAEKIFNTYRDIKQAGQYFKDPKFDYDTQAMQAEIARRAQEVQADKQRYQDRFNAVQARLQDLPNIIAQAKAVQADVNRYRPGWEENPYQGNIPQYDPSAEREMAALQDEMNRGFDQGGLRAHLTDIDRILANKLRINSENT